MIKRISRRAIWFIWSIVLVVACYGLTALETSGVKPETRMPQAAETELTPKTKLQAYFNTSAEAMWVTGLVASLVTIVLIGYMGGICSRAYAEAQAMQLEAIEALNSCQREHHQHDPSS